MTKRLPKEIRVCAYFECGRTFEVTATNPKKYCDTKCYFAMRKGKTHIELYGCEKAKSIQDKYIAVRKGKTYEEIYGVKRAAEVAKNISVSIINSEYRHPEEVLKKIVETRKKNRKPESEETKKKRLETRKNNGQPWHSLETIEKMSQTRLKLWQDPDFIIAHSGENAPNYLGVTGEYSRDFTLDLKNWIKERDNYTCQICKLREEQLRFNLSIHHIDYDKWNSDTENLISLCRSCHTSTNFNRDYWTETLQMLLEVK